MEQTMVMSTSILESELNTPAKNCYRLVVFGSSKVGKTSIVKRFLTGEFIEQYTPTIEDFHRKIYKIRGEVYRLDILDTSGNNPFPAMNRLSILTGDAFMLVYTIDNKETFQEVLRIRQQIIDTKRAKGIKSTPMVLAGNKVDRDDFREIDFDDARRAVSSAKRCSCLEVSAKDNINIDCLFHSLFEHARLPSEMTPSLHRKVGGSDNGGPPDLSPKSNPRGITLRKRISDACGVISPNARRPSLRSDLLQVRNNALRSVKRGDMDEEEEPSAEGTGFRKKRGCIVQ